MKVLTKGILFFVLGASLATVAHGQLWKKKAQREATKVFKDLPAHDTCAHKISVALNWKAITKADHDKQSYNGRCADVMSGLSSVCEKGTDEKDAAKVIKKVYCTYSPKAKKLDLSLKNGTLTAKFNWDTSNVNSETIKWLENNL